MYSRRELKRERGDSMPGLFEVVCPLVRTKIRVKIPSMDEEWNVVTRDYIIDQCSRAMENSFAWKTVVQLPILNGRRLELGWRTGTRLDWVWLKDSVDGERRDWEVLYGVALQQVCECSRVLQTYSCAAAGK